MAVKVIIRRKIPKDKEGDILPLLNQLRSRAMMQKGYISGETWRNIEDPEEYLVISTWKSYEDWKAWKEDPDRAEIQEKIDKLLNRETQYSVYLYG